MHANYKRRFKLFLERVSWIYILFQMLRSFIISLQVFEMIINVLTNFRLINVCLVCSKRVWLPSEWLWAQHQSATAATPFGVVNPVFRSGLRLWWEHTLAIADWNFYAQKSTLFSSPASNFCAVHCWMVPTPLKASQKYIPESSATIF